MMPTSPTVQHHAGSPPSARTGLRPGPAPRPPEQQVPAETQGQLPDGRGVTLVTGEAQAQALPPRPPKRHHDEMAPTLEARLPEPDRKARIASPRTPSQPGCAVIDHVFTHSPYATPRLDLVPIVVGQAAHAALLSNLVPEQRELAGRELARRLGRQADTREVQVALFRKLHRLLATTKEQASTQVARACIGDFLRGMASGRASAAQDTLHLLSRFFSQAMRRMSHAVVNFEEDLQAAIDVVGAAAEGTGLRTPELLAAMLRETLPTLAGPTWDCRVSPEAWACQLLAGKLAEAGRTDPGTRPALVQVLVDVGKTLEGHVLGCLVAGLGETTPQQAREDLRGLLMAPGLSARQQGDAAWGLACGLVAGPAGLAQPIPARAASLLVGDEGRAGQAVVEQLMALAEPEGMDLQVRLMRALLESRREATSALREDFLARREQARQQGADFDRTATAVHRIDAALAAALKGLAGACPRLALFELLARYARATGVKASSLESQGSQGSLGPPGPQASHRADILAGLRLDPTDPAQLAAFKRLSVTDRIALMEALGPGLSVRDREELAERIAHFHRAKADPELRIALLTRLLQGHAALAGPLQLRAVRQALVEDLQALGGPGLRQGLRDHLGGLYTAWRQAQGMGPWLDEGLPVPADDRPAVRQVRDALAGELRALRELREQAAVPGLQAAVDEDLAPALQADLSRLDAALKAPPPCIDD